MACRYYGRGPLKSPQVLERICPKQQDVGALAGLDRARIGFMSRHSSACKVAIRNMAGAGMPISEYIFIS